MPAPIDVDHPAVGAGHLYLPGSADSIVAASLMVARAPWPAWVVLAREHRLRVLLERPLAEVAAEIWCLGYTGTGNPLLTQAIEAHVTHRPVYWLSSTSGRLTLEEAELPGLRFESFAGGSLVHLVQRHTPGPWTDEDRAYERLGYILGRFPGARPSDFELELVNRLHAAAVQVRNHEDRGADLVRALAGREIGTWMRLPTLGELAAAGEVLIRRARQVLLELPQTRGGGHGPALWIVDAGSIPRGAHGKAAAARAYARQAPVALVERVPRGFTKAWVVLPPQSVDLWPAIAHTFAGFSADFAYTGLRGAGAIAAADVDAFADALWERIGGS